MPLTENEIIKVHRLAEQGFPVNRIASMLEVHRNTVTRHLRLRGQYSSRLVGVIGSPKHWDNQAKCHRAASTALPSTRGIRIYDAAVYLPGWPSADRMNKLRRAGVVAANLNGRSLHMTEALIRRAARAMLPLGVWFDSRTLGAYFDADSAASILSEFRGLAEDCKFWPCRRYFYLPAQAITSGGYDMKLPAGVMTRVCECLRISGVATL